ncbi:hypothetical protein E2C01_038192 [Portunus trituberculatus]|uniref:Uncharacterized protein n=1 Tax=Portunus trituberculatus TaxID=210409 RepID=A0A5B7FGX4_PORTR|nr:hypothetical protein [Portunus trituberculatus]
MKGLSGKNEPWAASPARKVVSPVKLGRSDLVHPRCGIDRLRVDAGSAGRICPRHAKTRKFRGVMSSIALTRRRRCVDER